MKKNKLINVRVALRNGGKGRMYIKEQKGSISVMNFYTDEYQILKTHRVKKVNFNFPPHKEIKGKYISLLDKLKRREKEVIKSIPDLLGIDIKRISYENIKVYILRVGDNIGWLWENKMGQKYGNFITVKENNIETQKEVIHLLLNQAEVTINKLNK